MRWRAVFGNVGSILKFFSLALIVPIVPALLHETPTALFPRWEVLVPLSAVVFAGLAVGTFLLGILLEWWGGREDFRDYEGFFIVGVGWIILSLVAAIPFYALGAVTNPVDAFFEAMSGLTTTGFTALPGAMEDHLPSILFWRAFLEWIGGGGIIVLTVAILSKMTESGGRLMRAELPGGVVTRLKPKITQTAKTLWGVYLLITILSYAVIASILRYRVGHDWSLALGEGLLYTLTSISTGGMAPHSASLGVYGDWVLEVVVIGVMVLGATSFVLLYYVANGSPKRLLRDAEWRFFLVIVLAAAAVVTANLLWTVANFPGDAEVVAMGSAMGLVGDWSLNEAAIAFRYALFQATSIITTTGFNTVNYDVWPAGTKLVFLVLMLTGACMGSTTGAIKVARILLLFKLAGRELHKLVHPRAHIPIRMGKNVVPEETLRGVVAFFFVYLTLVMVATLAFTFAGFDLVESAGMSAASIGNVGTAFGGAGPAGAVYLYPDWIKLTMAALMWVGRLEIFTVLILFFPMTYTR